MTRDINPIALITNEGVGIVIHGGGSGGITNGGGSSCIDVSPISI